MYVSRCVCEFLLKIGLKYITVYLIIAKRRTGAVCRYDSLGPGKVE